MPYDFANLLFSGPCNARCPFCIGQQVESRLNVNNLDEFPPRNLERWIELIWEHGIRQVTFTGTNTDPQLYRHEGRLLAYLRQRLPGGTKISLHTNGRLALRKMQVFNQYDRATLSLPSFDPQTYQRMMGVGGPPDIEDILRKCCISLKISCIISEENRFQAALFLSRCAALGVRRVVLRKLYGEPRPWPALLPFAELPLTLRGEYRNNPVYDFQGMEVTLWDFEQTDCTSINLFSSGVISTAYQLADIDEFLK